MITGVVSTDLEATIRLRVQGPCGQQREIEVVIDTGFNGSLTLPTLLSIAFLLHYAASLTSV